MLTCATQSEVVIYVANYSQLLITEGNELMMQLAIQITNELATSSSLVISNFFQLPTIRTAMASYRYGQLYQHAVIMLQLAIWLYLYFIMHIHVQLPAGTYPAVLYNLIAIGACSYIFMHGYSYQHAVTLSQLHVPAVSSATCIHLPCT